MTTYASFGINSSNRHSSVGNSVFFSFIPDQLKKRLDAIFNTNQEAIANFMEIEIDKRKWSPQGLNGTVPVKAFLSIYNDQTIFNWKMDLSAYGRDDELSGSYRLYDNDNELGYSPINFPDWKKILTPPYDEQGKPIVLDFEYDYENSKIVDPKK